MVVMAPKDELECQMLNTGIISGPSLFGIPEARGLGLVAQPAKAGVLERKLKF